MPMNKSLKPWNETIPLVKAGPFSYADQVTSILAEQDSDTYIFMRFAPNSFS